MQDFPTGYAALRQTGYATAVYAAIACSADTAAATGSALTTWGSLRPRRSKGHYPTSQTAAASTISSSGSTNAVSRWFGRADISP